MLNAKAGILFTSVGLALVGCSDETIAGYVVGAVRAAPSDYEVVAYDDLDDGYEDEASEDAGYDVPDEIPAPQVPEPVAYDPEPVAPRPAPRRAPEPQPEPEPLARVPDPEPAPAPRAAPEPAPMTVDVMQLDLPGMTAIDSVYVAKGIGRHVYPTCTYQLKRKDRERADPPVVFAGERLTLVEAKPFNRDGQPLTYNYVVVRRADGSEGTIQIQYLSATPLCYDLTQPGDAKTLIRNLCREALRAGVEFHRTLNAYAYDIPRDPPEVYEKAYHRRQVYEAGFKFARSLAGTLARGSHSSSANILRNPMTRWAPLADDPSVLEAYENGIQDDPEFTRFSKAADRVLGRLQSLRSYGFDLARVEAERKREGWLRGMKDLPAEAVAKLTEKELAKLAARQAELEQRMQDALREAGERYVEAFGAPR
ncbi:MAG: hypothetical protein R3F62_30955 [Planctomycetota bacterium]